MTWVRPDEWVIERIVVTGQGNGVIRVADERSEFPLILFLVNGAAILFLFGLGLASRDKVRWMAFTFAAILLTGLSFTWIYSLGGFLWPFGVILLIVSLLKLSQYRKAGNEAKYDVSS